MDNGMGRFNYYLDQIEVLLIEAEQQENPALYLFKNNARTSYFMLEGLAKLYAGIQNPKKFGKIKEHFKQVEDSLGQIDYYNWLLVAIQGNIKIPIEYHQYVQKELDNNVIKLNLILKDKGWISTSNKRLLKISDKLKEINWLTPQKEVDAIIAFYKTSISDINLFVSKSNYHFDNVEKEVHELRRKLRWLSIYPQAMQGIFQYASDTNETPQLKKYLTKEITNSVFNKLPLAGNNSVFVLLNKNYFYALSWIIAQLGNLKDEGLLLIGLADAIKKCKGISKEEAINEASTLLGKNQHSLQKILDDADLIIKSYFEEKNLDHLLINK